MKIIGIYKIESRTSGKFYIGSTLNIKSRWSRHKSDLRARIHHSLILQRAWDKYGENDFEFTILEECGKEKILEREQDYLDKLLPVYNICPNAQNCLGKRDSEETKKKKRDIALKLGIKPPKETWEKKQKQVTALDETGNPIQHFVSLAEACRFVGRDCTYVSTITRAIKRDIKAYGYKWEFKK